jgi:cyclophilin family peptidyl-prolyl cis-trans isomerase
MRTVAHSVCFPALIVAGGLFSAALLAQETTPKSKAPAKAPPAAKAKAPPSATPQAAPKGADAESPPAEADKPATPIDPSKPAAAEYARLFEEWKSLLKDLRKLKAQYQSADEAGQKTINEQWNQLVTKGNELLAQLELAGIKAYEESPNEDPQLVRFLVKVAADHISHDQYEAAYAIAQPLVAHDCFDKQILDSAGAAAYVLNDFDKALEYFKAAQVAGVLSKYSQELAPTTEEYKKLWAEEQKIREAEAAKDDLPRVKLTTSKGDIVVELFENEAPETVGNFISLVEKKDENGKGYFEDVPFHRVLANFMAQGGDPTGTGQGGPGYNIYCECYKDDYRRHFAGTLSMAHAGRDTGGSQFFLTFRPTPHLNGRHTAFGRVIEGWDVLPKLLRRDPDNPGSADPDKILKAEVLRKRDHAYVPHKVE